jgi:hypothetical protein
MVRGAVFLSSMVCLATAGFAQNSANRAASPAASIPTASIPTAAPDTEPTVSAKWRQFEQETLWPLTLGAGAWNGAFSQITHSDPLYGVGAGALAERFGASTADVVTQNFFGDFVMASVLHENVIYERMGPAYGGIFKRAGHAISRAFITRSDSGGHTFNWSNLIGTAMSAGFSNIYYPAASRSGDATALHFGTSVLGGGFANLFPEFWPDFRGMLQRHHLFPRGH